MANAIKIVVSSLSFFFFSFSTNDFHVFLYLTAADLLVEPTKCVIRVKRKGTTNKNPALLWLCVTWLFFILKRKNERTNEWTVIGNNSVQHKISKYGVNTHLAPGRTHSEWHGKNWPDKTHYLFYYYQNASSSEAHRARIRSSNVSGRSMVNVYYVFNVHFHRYRCLHASYTHKGPTWPIPKIKSIE